MLRIQNAQGLTLNLEANGRLAVELLSTLFNTNDELPGSHSYPFRIPMDENNQRFLDNRHRSEREAQPLMAVDVAADGLHFRASLGFRRSGRYADAWLLVELGEVASTLRRQSIRTLVTDTYHLGNSTIQLIQTLKRLAQAPPAEYPLVFPPLRNERMVEEAFSPNDHPFTPPVTFNRYNPVVGGYVASARGTDGQALLVPCVYVAWLIRRLCQAMGYTAQGSFFTDPDLVKLILLNTQTMPGYHFAGGSYQVRIGRHLPDISIGDFFKALRSWCGCGIFFDAASRTATFTTYRNIRFDNRPVPDLSDSYIPHQDQVEEPVETGFVLNSAVEKQDELLAERAGYRKSFVVKQPDREINLEIGTTFMSRVVNNDHPTGLFWLVPHLKQKGNLADPFYEKSNHFAPYTDADDPTQVPETKNNFGLTCLLYHGMQPDAVGNLYPYASSVSYNARYQAVSGLSLLPGEPDDMFKRYQRLYYEWLANARTLTVPMLLPVSRLGQLRLSQPVGLKTAYQVYAKYLIESLTYELPAQDGLVLAKAKLRQLLPIVLRHTTADPDLYNAVWVQLVYENETTSGGDAQGSDFLVTRADLVVYLWEDGTFQTPANPPTTPLNYTTVTLEYQADGNVIRTELNATAPAFGHRYVLLPQTTRSLATKRAEGQFYTDTVFTHQLQPGTGYRL
jgi:hypothetical protein